MHRLFVAIRPPRLIRERLLGLMGGVAGVRWQTDEQLHITLRFIGKVDRHQAEDVAAALTSVRHPRFDLSLERIGSFGRRGQPGILWAGVSPGEPLVGLHKKVDLACARAGLNPERRAYRPHITLARLKRGSGSPDGFVASADNLTSAPFEVKDFGLFESNLSADGASYSVVERYPLAPPPGESD